MASKLNVISICGSLRKGSFNAMVMRALPGLAPEGMTITPAPPYSDFPLYNFDIQKEQGIPRSVVALAEAMLAADGVVIVSAEYNFSVPPGLKNAIDWVSRLKDPPPFTGKPFAIQSATTGPVGGARMQYHLRQILAGLDAFILNKPEIFIGNAASKVDEKTGELTDETTRDFIKKQLAAFATFIERVRP
ncbi:MAG TPA: NAD(P)H-dependent oxidoreductase [Xanthobacteraceae bacterium]|nr:NAD(P)H-dependent oxidoreductase [Xanthobacteraceae bacterium]